MAEPRQIILDCDPGHDDAMAIMLALGHPGIEVRAITTVGGNQTLEKVTRNARSVLTVCRREDVPVYAGAVRPLVRPVQVAEAIHGDSGLDGVELPQPTAPLQTGHAATYLVEAVMASEPGTLTLVATGPLTNLALAVRLEPRIVDRVREVVLMGGGYHGGNWTAAAEFNIWVDPEAAHIVFAETWPLTMVGLDLTYQARLTAQVEQRIVDLGTAPARFFAGTMGFFRSTYRQVRGFDDPPMHDPCTIAYLIDPAIVQTRKAPVQVELHGQHTTGMTVADLRGPAPADCHTQVATTLDVDRFWDLVVEAVRALG